jgi:hypothetical protein
MSDITPDPGAVGSTEHLNTLVGEGKKYADSENLAKGYANLESLVDTIKLEKVELLEKLGIKEAQDDHLETIVNLLKVDPEPIVPVVEPVVTEPVIPKPPEKEVTPIVPVNTQLNMQQFAKDAVTKYGNADTVGKHLQEYIGGDKGRQALVNTMMQTDPSALLKILPAKDKSFNPTGSEGTPQNNGTSLPLTWEDCVKVRKDNPAKFNSPKFVKQMMEARNFAKSKGIPFETA